MASTNRGFRTKYGEWALVTGASAGIGLAFAKALAHDEKMSIVLTARREDRLLKLADEFKREHGVETRVVAADLADPGGAIRLADAVADLPIAMLVNNAGFGYAGRFDKLETERLAKMVIVNCLAPVVLTSKILPGMVKRGRGAVIVVGSVAGRQPLPLHAVYSATKGFDLLFGEGLWGELRGTGVDAIVLEPGATKTEFQEVAGEVVGDNHGEPPENVVRVTFDALGKRPSVVSGWGNYILANATRLVPRSTAARIAKRVVQGNTRPELR
ncbi:MAG TPA: SDR family oxidoreductase [Candidatus Binataceae bacterium]|nr:SDR family oxidoreductase [Candidatus Binataceae bacterium]